MTNVLNESSKSKKKMPNFKNQYIHYNRQSKDKFLIYCQYSSSLEDERVTCRLLGDSKVIIVYQNLESCQICDLYVLTRK